MEKSATYEGTFKPFITDGQWGNIKHVHLAEDVELVVAYSSDGLSIGLKDIHLSKIEWIAEEGKLQCLDGGYFGFKLKDGPLKGICFNLEQGAYFVWDENEGIHTYKDLIYAINFNGLVLSINVADTSNLVLKFIPLP